MIWSEEELHAVLSQNPHLKVHGLNVPNKAKSIAASDSKTEVKPPKYRNHKVYVYEDGFADIKMPANMAESFRYMTLKRNFEDITN